MNHKLPRMAGVSSLQVKSKFLVRAISKSAYYALQTRRENLKSCRLMLWLCANIKWQLLERWINTIQFILISPGNSLRFSDQTSHKRSLTITCVLFSSRPVSKTLFLKAFEETTFLAQLLTGSCINSTHFRSKQIGDLKLVSFVHLNTLSIVISSTLWFQLRRCRCFG